MTIYGLVFRPNPDRGHLLLGYLGLRPAQVGAYRDAWLEADPEGDARITVYTANGGPSDYTGPGPEERWERWTAALTDLPLCQGYRCDARPHAGTWYVSYYFRLPAPLLAAIENQIGRGPLRPAVDTDARWRDALAILEPDGLEPTAEETS